MLIRQFEYEDPIVRGGKHLLHSPFFKELVALACDLQLDSLPCCSGDYFPAEKRRGLKLKVGLLLQKLTNGLGFDGIAWPQGSPDLSSKGMV